MDYLFFQSALRPVEFRNFFPASIFVFETQLPENRQLQFDFRDTFLSLAISIRVGRVCILATLQDGEAQRMMYADALEEFRHMRLHPIQWMELVAMYFYRSTLMNRVPKYMVAERDGVISVMQMPLGGSSARPLMTIGKTRISPVFSPSKRGILWNIFMFPRR